MKPEKPKSMQEILDRRLPLPEGAVTVHKNGKAVVIYEDPQQEAWDVVGRRGNQ